MTAGLFRHSGSPDLSADTMNGGTTLRYHGEVWQASSGSAVLANNKAAVEERDQGGDGRAQHKMYMNGRKKHARARGRERNTMNPAKEREEANSHMNAEASAHVHAHAERVHPSNATRMPSHSLCAYANVHPKKSRERERESRAPKRETPSRTAQRLTHTTPNRSHDVRGGGKQYMLKKRNANTTKRNGNT